jgi:hypothetical protein
LIGFSDFDLNYTDINDAPLLEVGNPLVMEAGEKYNLKLRKKIE